MAAVGVRGARLQLFASRVPSRNPGPDLPIIPRPNRHSPGSARSTTSTRVPTATLRGWPSCAALNPRPCWTTQGVAVGADPADVTVDRQGGRVHDRELGSTDPLRRRRTYSSRQQRHRARDSRARRRTQESLRLEVAPRHRGRRHPLHDPRDHEASRREPCCASGRRGHRRGSWRRADALGIRGRGERLARVVAAAGPTPSASRCQDGGPRGHTVQRDSPLVRPDRLPPSSRR